MTGMRVERLDHLGIVAGVCQEIGLTRTTLPEAPSASTCGVHADGKGASSRVLLPTPQLSARYDSSVTSESSAEST